MRKQSNEQLTWTDVFAFLLFLALLAAVLYVAADAIDKQAIYSEAKGKAYASGDLARIEAVDDLR